MFKNVRLHEEEVSNEFCYSLSVAYVGGQGGQSPRSLNCESLTADMWISMPFLSCIPVALS